jgi:hypothetical protein
MKKLSLGSLIAVAALAASASAFAQNAKFSPSRTFEYDPDKTGVVSAYWDRNSGETDSTGNTKFGLHLEKNSATGVNASAGAVLDGLKGVVVQAGDKLGYDMKNTSQTLQSGPRFNVSWSLNGVAGFSFVGGLGTTAPTPGQQAGWSHYEWDMTSPAQTNPTPVPPGATIEQIVLIVDEGPLVYDLDNINYNAHVAGKPGSSN